MKLDMLSWPIDLFKLMLNFVHINIQGRELNLVILKSGIWYMAAHEPISFKLGIMIDMTKLNILMQASVTLIFTQGHKVVRN